MSRDWRLYLEDIERACEKVGRFTQGCDFESFVADERTYDAVLRNLEVIGEAAKRVPDNVRAQMPEVPWRAIAGFRDFCRARLLCRGRSDRVERGSAGGSEPAGHRWRVPAGDGIAERSELTDAWPGERHWRLRSHGPRSASGGDAGSEAAPASIGVSTWCP